MKRVGGICPACGGNMAHNNACPYGKQVNNASSHQHRQYGNMFNENPNEKLRREQQEREAVAKRVAAHKEKHKHKHHK